MVQETVPFESAAVECRGWASKHGFARFFYWVMRDEANNAKWRTPDRCRVVSPDGGLGLALRHTLKWLAARFAAGVMVCAAAARCARSATGLLFVQGMADRWAEQKQKADEDLAHAGGIKEAHEKKMKVWSQRRCEHTLRPSNAHALLPALRPRRLAGPLDGWFRRRTVLPACTRTRYRSLHPG